MKRSEINNILYNAVTFIRSHHFHLPPFAYWSLTDWQSKGSEIQGIIQANLGWDITDFGKGNFDRFGLVLFTIRNGIPSSQATGGIGKTYCEKILLVRQNQATPMHYHWTKAEDIINRSGGVLVVQVYNATPEDTLAESDVTVETDGIIRTVAAGSKIYLQPGESITLTQRLYHTFWAEEGDVLAGEVSKVNDDQNDNRFLQPIGRFPEIIEDSSPLYLLCNDYEKFLRN